MCCSVRVVTLAAAAHYAYYRMGPNTFAIDVEAFEFGGLRDKPSTLANAGLLLATLFQGEQEIIQISMVRT